MSKHRWGNFLIQAKVPHGPLVRGPGVPATYPFSFHKNLATQLECRMARWSEGPQFQRIGDVMVRNAPFLKMYTEYVKNFDTAMTAINSLCAKNRQFQAIMDEIHVSIPVQSSPVQSSPV